MQKDKSLHKAPRMSNGVKFSSFKGVLQQQIEKLNKAALIENKKTPFDNITSMAKRIVPTIPEYLVDQSMDIFMSFLMATKTWHSFYIMDSSAVDFLKTHQPKESDIEATAVICEELKKHSQGIAIHLAGERHSIFCVTCSSVFADSNADFIGFKRNDDWGYAGFSPEFLSDKYDSSHQEDQVNETWRIICNLMLYLMAFPDCVKNQPPPILKELRNGKEQSCIYGSEKISECFGNKRNLSPHFRRGHIRILRSDKFTKKQYSAIYIKPAMVKGKSTTIIAGDSNA